MTVSSNYLRDIILSPNIAPQLISENDKKLLVVMIFETVKHSKSLYITCVDVDQKNHVIAPSDDGCAPNWEDLFSYLAYIKVGYFLSIEQQFYSIIIVFNTDDFFLTLIERDETNAYFNHLFYYLLLITYYLLIITYYSAITNSSSGIFSKTYKFV